RRRCRHATPLRPRRPPAAGTAVRPVPGARAVVPGGRAVRVAGCRRDWRRPPQYRALQRAAVAAVGSVLDGDRPLRHAELAPRRADAGDAAVAAAGPVPAGRPAFARRGLDALCGRHGVAAGGWARVLVGMA